MPLLLKTEDALGGYAYPIEGTLTIGRGASNSVNVDHFDVGRRHAELRADGAGAEFVDCGSATGSQVNGRPVAPNVAIRVQAGDTITIGGVVTFVVIEATAPARAPMPAPPPVASQGPTAPASPEHTPRPAASSEARRFSGKALVAGLGLMVAVGAILGVVLVPGGDDESPAVSGRASASATTATAASPTARPSNAPPSAAMATPTSTAPATTVPAATPLPSVTPPTTANGRSRLTSGMTAVVTLAGCALKASIEATEGPSRTNRVVLELCEGDEVIVATNSPVDSTVRVTEGLVFWRVLVKKSGDVLWVKEVEVESGRRFLNPVIAR